MRLTIHAKPRAKKSRVVAAAGLTAEVALAAPPVDGAANDELVRFLAEVLDVKKRDLRIAVGEGSRHKLVDVDGLDAATVEARLALVAAAGG